MNLLVTTTTPKIGAKFLLFFLFFKGVWVRVYKETTTNHSTLHNLLYSNQGYYTMYVIINDESYNNTANVK